MRDHRAVTMTELLGAAVGVSCLVGILLTALSDAKDAANRAVCAANLSRLGQGLWLYAEEHDGFLPDCGAYSPLAGPKPDDARFYPSRFNAPGTLSWGDVMDAGNQGNLWLLIREGYAAPGLFICPATADKPSLNDPHHPRGAGFLAVNPDSGQIATADTRFLSRVHAGRCSYSYQNQLVPPATWPEVADPRNSTTNIYIHQSRLAILADRNPYTRTDGVRQPIVSPRDEAESNSLNHRMTGQNVLYLGGEVEWHDSPRCGLPRGDGAADNIYWPDAGEPDDPLNVPRSLDDSYLVP
jgi:hypothetical protein